MHDYPAHVGYAQPETHIHLYKTYIPKNHNSPEAVVMRRATPHKEQALQRLCHSLLAVLWVLGMSACSKEQTPATPISATPNSATPTSATPTPSNQKPTHQDPSTPNLSSFIWSVADLLRGDFKQSQHGRVILPFALLRGLECVLAKLPEMRAMPIEMQGPLLLWEASSDGSPRHFFYTSAMALISAAVTGKIDVREF